MIKKIITNLILIFFLFLILLVITLSTVGVKTNKFNNFISKKISQSTNKINLTLNEIKFKLDIKELSLFLDTQNPKVNYQDLSIPVRNIKVYIDLISLLKSDPKIIKTNLVLKELDINQIKKLSKIIKPSNFKSLINNKIKEGKLNSEIEIYLDENGSFKNFIAKGFVTNLEVELIKNLNLTKILSLLSIEINLSIVAAVLTIVGYSMNEDTQN